jgi:hypothetical protein
MKITVEQADEMADAIIQEAMAESMCDTTGQQQICRSGIL